MGREYRFGPWGLLGELVSQHRVELPSRFVGASHLFHVLLSAVGERHVVKLLEENLLGEDVAGPHFQFETSQATDAERSSELRGIS